MKGEWWFGWWVWQCWGETLYVRPKEKGLIICWENFKYDWQKSI